LNFQAGKQASNIQAKQNTTGDKISE